MDSKSSDKKPEINLYDYVLTYKKGNDLMIESVVQKLSYYEAYVKALDRLRPGRKQ